MQGIDPYVVKVSFDKSYNFLRKSNDLEMVEFVQRERYNSEYDHQETVQVLDQSHLIFNSMFCVNDDFSAIMTKLDELEIPAFTYYSGINRIFNYPNASRSTSQNVRLYDDTESSPITQTNYKKSFEHDHRSINSQPGKMKKAHYRNSELRNSKTQLIRPLSTAQKPSKIILKSDISKE